MRRFSISLLSLAGCALIAGCAHGGSSSSTASSAPSGASAGATAVASAPANAPNGAEANAGGSVYVTNCSSCHGATGDGLPGAFPPLAGNPVVVGDATAVVHIVKYGRSGALVVKGQRYSGVMPAWNGTLSDTQIAQVITYVRASWGNHAGAVSPAQVAAVKK